MFADITDVQIVKNDIYVFHTDGDIRKLQLFQVPQVISILIQRKNLLLAAELCCVYEDVLCKSKWRKHFTFVQLQELLEQLWAAKSTDAAEKLKNVVFSLENSDILETDSESNDSIRSRSSSVASHRTDVSSVAGTNITRVLSMNSLALGAQKYLSYLMPENGPEITDPDQVSLNEDMWNTTDLDNTVDSLDGNFFSFPFSFTF